MLDKRKLSKAVKDKYSFANETFFHTAKAHLKDRIEVEIGDSKQPDFKPQFKVMRWDNEVNFSMRAQEHPNAIVDTEGEKIKYRTPDYEVHQYDKPEAGEDGGFEFEWFLPKKPASNILTATIQTKELDFFYQKPITEEIGQDGITTATETLGFDKEGNVIVERPENVVGSYAIYHKTKGGVNDAAGMDYKVGKVAHIYRPKAVDANGDEIWAELHIDTNQGILTVTIDEKWLEKAHYPVIVDPTIGYTSQGATGIVAANSDSVICSGLNTSVPSGGSVTEVQVYASATSNTAFRGGIYKTDNVLQSPQNTSPTTITSTAGWFVSSWSGPTLSAGSSYMPAILTDLAGSNNPTVFADSGGASGDSKFQGSGVTYPTWPDPFVPTNSTNKRSIYATYTAAGGSDPTPLRMLMGMGT